MLGWKRSALLALMCYFAALRQILRSMAGNVWSFGSCDQMLAGRNEGFRKMTRCEICQLRVSRFCEQ